MGKRLFSAFFLFACTTTTFGKEPDLPPPTPYQLQQIERMFDLTKDIAETVCAGSSDVASVLNSWLSSRSHAGILMDPAYINAGIGLARGATRTYWVLMPATRPNNSWPGRSWNLKATL
jgi:uncharacterized protein YkwD